MGCIVLALSLCYIVAHSRCHPTTTTISNSVAERNHIKVKTTETACLDSTTSGTCASWFHCDTHCHDKLLGMTRCADNTTLVLDCNCVTFNEEIGTTETGKCIYNCGHYSETNYFDLLYNPLPEYSANVTDYMCTKQFKRTGTLCGKCKDGFFPLAYSYDMICVECPNGKSNWWKYILAAFLPLTIFYFIIVFLKINITSSHFYAFVYFSQGIAIPALARAGLASTRNRPYLQVTMRALGNFFGIWNLDFLRFNELGICLGTNTMQTLALDLLIGVYPLLLIMLSYTLVRLHDHNFRIIVYIWKPFQAILRIFRRNWEIKTSLIDAFATFFLLSNVKFLSVSYDLLAPVEVYQINAAGDVSPSWRLFFDATLPYFGEQHRCYAILACIVFTLYVLCPMLLLLFYPFRCFQKILNLLPLRWYILHTFIDSFQGCYKDGTEPGTRDSRWLSFVFLQTQCIMMVIGGYTMGSMFFVFAAMVQVLLVALLVNTQPFKSHLKHLSEAHFIFHLLLAAYYTAFLGSLEAELKRSTTLSYALYTSMAAVSIVPLVYISAIILHWLYDRRLFGLEMVRRFHAWKTGYSSVG